MTKTAEESRCKSTNKLSLRIFIVSFLNDILKCGVLFNREEVEVVYCHLSHLFFFGIKLEAFVQGAVVLLQVLLLLAPHTLCVFHHLLMDAAKQTEANTVCVVGMRLLNCVSAVRISGGVRLLHLTKIKLIS